MRILIIAYLVVCSLVYKSSAKSEGLYHYHSKIDTINHFLKNLLQLDNPPLPYQKKSRTLRELGSDTVTMVEMRNFDNVVTNNGKDTLIEFYAPWCPYCKKLNPVYNELGDKLKGEDVAIVKMDATGEVPPSYNVAKFPTIYWIPKDARTTPIRYEGGQGLDDFIKYIASHSKNELKGFDRRGNPKVMKSNFV